MAEKQVKKNLRKKIDDFFKGRGDKVKIKSRDGNIVRVLNSTDEFIDFYSKPHNRQNVTNYIHEVEPKRVSEKDPVNSIKAAEGAYRQIARSASGKQSISVTHGGRAKDAVGDELVSPKTSKSKLLNALDIGRKTQIVNSTADSKILEIAKHKNSQQYYKVLKDYDVANGTDAQKADAIRDFVNQRRMTVSKGSSPDKFASGIVWEAGKDKDLVQSLKTRFGSNAYDEINSSLSRNKSSPATLLKLQKKDINREFGKTGTPGRKIFDRIKSDNNWTDGETARYLKTPQGRGDFEGELKEMLRNRDIKPGTAKTIARKQKLTEFKTKEIEVEYKSQKPSYQKAQVATDILGYSSGPGTSVKPVVKFLHKKLESNPEALRAMEKGEDISRFKPSSVSYNELRQFYGGEVKTSDLKRLQSHGIEIEGLPPDKMERLSNVSEKSSGGRTVSISSKVGRGGSTGTRKSSYSSGEGILGKGEITYVGGKPVYHKKAGRIGSALHGVKTHLPGIRSAAEKEEARIKKYREKEKAKKKIYEELKEAKEYQYLSDEEKRLAAGGGRIGRWWTKRKGKVMYRDPAVRARKLAKQEEKKGVYEARLRRAQLTSEQRMRAATSPFWRAWYWISHNTMVIVGIALVLALLFIPVGLFYVLGWAMAVGIVSLVMFIVWVFLEFWWLIAQAIVSVINILGQIIIGFVNWVGGAIAGAMGAEFVPFEHVLIQNVGLVERDPTTGRRVLLGITWGEWNLVPPDFMKLDSFMPTTFDTDVILVKIWPGIKSLFDWYTGPIADRYTEWISEAEWYVVGATIGIPIVLIIIGIFVAFWYVRRKMI